MGLWVQKLLKKKKGDFLSKYINSAFHLLCLGENNKGFT